WLGAAKGIEGGTLAIPAFVLTVLAALLMVSSFSYYSFKDLNLTGRVRFTVVLFVLFMLVAVALDPPLVLFLVFLLYMSSVPVISLVRQHRRGVAPRDAGE